jgi:hypothetical protein
MTAMHALQMIAIQKQAAQMKQWIVMTTMSAP